MYEIWAHTPDYAQRTAIIAEVGAGWIFSKLAIERKENQVTEAVITLPYQPGIVQLFPLDTRLEFYDDGRLELETQWFVRVPPKLVYDDAGALVVEVHALCALYLLAGRIVAYVAGSAQAVKSGPADDLIKAIIRENLGSLASVADRNLSAYLDVAADVSQGATVHKTMPRRNVLLVCQEIARASAQAGKPIFFDVVWTGARLEFRTYLDARGADHRVASASPIVLSPEFGTLTNASRSFDHRDEATVVYCAGQGRGAERLIVSVSDDARRTQTPFNRRETYVDARYLSLTESVAMEADATLWHRRPVQELAAEFADTDTWRYGVDWGWGDLTAAELNGEVLAVRVHAVTITAVPGARRVRGELRADSTEADDAVRRIEGQLDQSAPDELPIFSLEPLADAAPLADADGKIADGWLPDSIARASDIPTALPPTAHAASHRHGGSDEIAAASPGPNAIPKAGPGGTLADGWLSATIARLADLTWGNIGGKPGSYPPSAHAHDGADIASGTIADARISAAIARLSDLTWGNIGWKPSTFASDWSIVANKPSTFAPSGHAASHKHGGADEVATTTPGADAIPKAGSGGTLADGWLSSAIARVADLTWANIGGKPTLFASDWSMVANKPASFAPPIASAATLGGVKVGANLSIDGAGVLSGAAPYTLPAASASTLGGVLASAAPLVGGVPLGGVGGTIADGWLSAAIARLDTVQTWTAKQTFADIDIKGSLNVGGVGRAHWPSWSSARSAAATATRIWISSATTPTPTLACASSGTTAVPTRQRRSFIGVRACSS